MTPKEKADEIVKKMYKVQSDSVSDITLYFSKKCALIAVDEIIDAIDWHEYEVPNNQLKFWFEVIKEIEKL